MADFFTSDTHFGHRKLAEMRGFASTEEMDDALIANWNRKVSPFDTVYHLGDLSFGNPEHTLDVLKRLNGTIKLVPGNHDRAKVLASLNVWSRPKLQIQPPLLDLKLALAQPDGSNIVERFVLCHFPMLVWNRCHYGSIHLHGHSHGSCRYPNPCARMLDVGVDPSGLAPVSLKEVLDIMRHRAAVSWDHHEARALQ